MSIPPVAAQPALSRRRRSTGGVLRRLHVSSLAFDVGLAVFMALLTVAGSIGESHPSQRYDLPGPGQHLVPAPAAAYLLVAAGALALAWRRRAPVAVLVASLAPALAYTCLGYIDGAVILNPVLAVYAVAVAVGPVRAIALSVLTTLALMAAHAAFYPLGATGGGFVLIPGLTAAALFLGLWVASRRAYATRDSEERARRAVDEERLRIARELHDVVAHTMATINVQAGMAGHVIREQPDEAAAALEAIRQASKEGLRELRGILNVLRQADEAEDRSPAPGLAQLDALVQGAAGAGLPTVVTVDGEPRPLPATVDLAAYRIVQESLTNALRHAGATTATVTVSYGERELVVDVTDAGRGPGPWLLHDGGGHGPSPGPLDHGGGHGLAGMRERVQTAGGALEAGAGPDGGFRVRARLPIGGSS